MKRLYHLFEKAPVIRPVQVRGRLYKRKASFGHSPSSKQTPRRVDDSPAMSSSALCVEVQDEEARDDAAVVDASESAASAEAEFAPHAPDASPS